MSSTTLASSTNRRYGEKLTRHGSPETSFDAAESIDASRMQQLVLVAMNRMQTYRPLPAEAWVVQREVEANLQQKISDSTIRTRLSELSNKGLVTVTDREGTSLTGHRCARYALAAKNEVA
jgi:DNA-binding transcriptional ArsR family regulator